MVQKQRVQFIDDVDGQPIPDGEQRSFSCVFGPREKYELDVSPDHHEAIRAALAPFLTGEFTPSGKRVTRTVLKPQRPPGPKRRTTANGHELSADERAAVRAWAIETDRMTATRGRIPQAVVDAYTAAHA